MKTLKNKFDEIIIKAYVKWTVLIWQIEDELKVITDELKKLIKR